MILFAVIFGLLFTGAILVIIGTVTKNRWGINLDSRSCPRCRTPISQLRKPQSLKQALWGGSTCQQCGTESDKWGREVPSQ
jgi:hypothetical protein